MAYIACNFQEDNIQYNNKKIIVVLVSAKPQLFFILFLAEFYITSYVEQMIVLIEINLTKSYVLHCKFCLEFLTKDWRVLMN